MRRVDPLVCSLGVLAGANVLNNRVARRWAPVTSAVATAALLGVARREGLTWPELGFERAELGARTGGLLAAGVAAVYAAGVALPRTRPLLRDERALALSRGRLLEEVLVQVPVGTVLLEEIGFRGVLPALLARRTSARMALAGSAALFGLWHVLPSMDMARANPALSGLVSDAPAHTAGRRLATARVVAGTVVSTAAAGVLFHELRRRGGLLAPSLFHLATNSFGYVAARVARRVSSR
ncbi:CPBP family intramembrane metalloprotease [Planotetraspora phitsanulokensis]|uniref:CAAX amino protease n=1 Tax=Planotetraspora phitsanulokensis TaxID=575192 RepID=A0A8J3U9I1_9ACTN|nr:CPBP family intramembrane glutamic endopeptidase [Planotetraspora phitsanulokensis]GII40511.1 CAAX amino protease [Planotetraspora phitsanulokensis]